MYYNGKKVSERVEEMTNSEECICALATPAGGAIGIIRLSGSEAIRLTDKVFVSVSGKQLSAAKPNTLHYGEIKDKDGHTIDDVLVSVFRAPHSYTGEDSTEISCHGSRYNSSCPRWPQERPVSAHFRSQRNGRGW